MTRQPASTTGHPRLHRQRRGPGRTPAGSVAGPARRRATPPQRRRGHLLDLSGRQPRHRHLGGDANYSGSSGSDHRHFGDALPSAPTITNLPGQGTYGGGFTATVSTDGDGERSVTSSTPAVCTASGLTVSYVGVGTCSLNAQVAAGTQLHGGFGQRADLQHRPGRRDDPDHHQHPVARQRVRGLHGQRGHDRRRHDVGHVQHDATSAASARTGSRSPSWASAPAR